MSVIIKKSGTKLTIKRSAPQSPANIREVNSMKGWRNRQHTHASPPPSWVKKLLGLS